MLISKYQSIRSYFGKWPVAKELTKYCMVGGLNTGIDFGLYIGLTRFFVFWSERFLAANIVAFLVANISSFFLNKQFTFRNTSNRFLYQYGKFIGVSLVYIALVQSILFLGVIELQLHDIVAKVFANAVGLAWNFIAHKYWSFNDK